MHTRRTFNKFCPTESLTARPIHVARQDVLRKFYECGFPYSRYVSWGAVEWSVECGRTVQVLRVSSVRMYIYAYHVYHRAHHINIHHRMRMPTPTHQFDP